MTDAEGMTLVFGASCPVPSPALQCGRYDEALSRAKHMAAGVTDRLWEVSDLVARLEADKRGLERAA